MEKYDKINFKVNYKNYTLYYTEEQKSKIDYMNDWKNTIKRLKWLIKNNKVKSNNVDTSYIAKVINNFVFNIKKLNDNSFMIQNGHAWEV